VAAVADLPSLADIGQLYYNARTRESCRPLAAGTPIVAQTWRGYETIADDEWRRDWAKCRMLTKVTVGTPEMAATAVQRLPSVVVEIDETLGPDMWKVETRDV
jgi:hypothetical protein